MKTYSHDALTSLQSLEYSLLNFLLYKTDKIELLSESDFNYFESKRVYRLILDKYQENHEVNPLEIHGLLTKDDALLANTIVFDSYFSINPENFDFYFKYLQELQRKELLGITLTNSISSLQKGVSKETVIHTLSEKLIAFTFEEKKQAENDIELYREFFDLDKPISKLNMAHSGLRSLDHALRNLTGGRLMVIAARPGQGKSALAVQIMVNSIFKNKKVAYLSLEMGKNEIISRMMANKYEFNVSEIQRGMKNALMNVMTSFSQNPFPADHLFLNDSIFKLSAINRKIREWADEGVELVIIDHIGLIDSELEGTRNDQLGKISRLLKQLTQQLQIPIIALSQLNRAAENENRMPQLADLRDSGNIEQDADAVLIFKHVSTTNDGIKHFNFGLLKNRAGIAEWLGERFAFNGCIQRFSEVMLNVQSR